MHWFPLPLLTELAQNGDSICQCKLGCKYLSISDVPRNLDESLKWFRLSADQGNAEAKDRIGLIYWVGAGVGQDLVEASKWFRKAAEQGESHAQYMLGRIFLNGLANTSSNVVEAYAWLTLARAGGYMSADELLSDCENEMTGAQMVEARILAQHLDMRIEATLLKDLLRLRKQEGNLLRAEREFMRRMRSHLGQQGVESMPTENTN